MAFSAPLSQARKIQAPNHPQMIPNQIAPQVDQIGDAAIKAMESLRANECPSAGRAGLINQLLRDISAQRLRPIDAKTVLKGIVEAIRNGYVPDDLVNHIANAVLGEMPTWTEDDRAAVLRDFLIAIADLGHSDLLRSAVAVSAIRVLDGFPEPSGKVRGDLTLWLGYVLVRNRIPQGLRDEVVRVMIVALRKTEVDRGIRGKIAWACSTLVDSAEYPSLPIDDIFSYADAEELSEKLREQIKNNLNRRALMSVGYF